MKFHRVWGFIIIFALFPAVALSYYEDVPKRVWYEDAVLHFYAEEVLDRSQQNFRPADEATRAEVIKFILETNGGLLQKPPEQSAFIDVSKDDWFYHYIHEAADEVLDYG